MWTIKKLSLLFNILAIFSLVFTQNIALATTPDEHRRAIRGGYPYYEVDDVLCKDETPLDKNESLYFMGDSILQGAEESLRAKITSNGVNDGEITVNGEISRSITGKGQEGSSGLDALKKDEQVIKSAGAVVIVLGTNGGNTEGNIEKMVKEIRKINKKTAVYWINIGVTREDLQKTMEDGNKALEKTAKDLDFSIINWYDEIKATDKDGLLRDQVHPNEKGYKVFSGIVNKELKDVIDGTISTGKSTSNVGGDNSKPAQVWAYLVSKEGLGLTSVQAAGVMGNIHTETGGSFNPKIRQGNGNSNEVIVDGANGYGLAQWTTSSRQQALKDHAETQGKSSGNMDVQLTFIKKELKGSFESTLNRLKKVNDDVIEATLVFHGQTPLVNVPGVTPVPGYEASGNTEAQVRNDRGSNSKKWLAKYGDKSSSYTDTIDCSKATDNEDFGVDGSKKYTDSPDTITRGKEVADQAKKWAKNDPNCGFHGSKGCTEQCLGIVSDLWRSVGKGMVSGETAWDAYKRYKKNGWVNTSKSIPVGAIMWSAKPGNEGAGHAYTYLGNGLIASNDIKTVGKYSVVSADDIEEIWNHKFYGWSEWHG